MTDKIWRGLVETVRSMHVALAAELGFVLPPTLFPIRDDRLIGYVRLRDVYRGSDAANGIAEMSLLAAAARADTVVAAWETLDIAQACEHVPLYDEPGLNVMYAVQGRHMVQRFPYREKEIRASREARRAGLRGMEPIWGPQPPAETNCELEPAISAMLDFCWKPSGVSKPNALEYAEAWLLEKGYLVRLTVGP